MPHHFTFVTTRDLGCLIVPFIYSPCNINSEDGSVGSVNQLSQVGGNTCHFNLSCFLLSDVLTDTNNTKQIAIGINAWGGIEEYINHLTTLGTKLKLKIGRVFAKQGALKNCLHRILELGTDEFCNKIMAHYFIFSVTCNVSSLLIPFIHTALCVYTKDWGICCVDQFAEIFGDCLQLLFCCLSFRNILPNTYHSGHAAIGITTGRCIQQHLYTLSSFGVEGEFKIGCFNAIQRIVQNRSHRIVII
mmetsp:Transcript_95828/g.165160  ORF Transcript_95828/g.165160 Transcript_95828/m.165160 type:complete len:246 (+) Transcript_95828:2151-2888(+)